MVDEHTRESLLHLVTALFMSSTVLAMQLAAPLLVATLVVDLVLGLIGKSMPQMNIMSVGVSLRTYRRYVADIMRELQDPVLETRPA